MPDTASACLRCTRAYSTLGSPTGLLKRLCGTCARCRYWVHRWCVRWGVPGWGIPGGYLGGWYTGLGSTPPHPARTIGIARAQPMPGPVSASTMALQAPCRSPPHTMAPRTQIRPLGPIKARFEVINPKVSLKSGVSSKKLDEAWHTPCFKKPLQKSRP